MASNQNRALNGEKDFASIDNKWKEEMDAVKEFLITLVLSL